MIDETKQIPKVTWNRRYRKLQQLIEQEDHFSEESVRMREVLITLFQLLFQIKPLLYFLYVGQYKRQGMRLASQEGAFYEFLTEQAQKYDYEVELQKQYAKLPINHDYPQLNSEKSIDETQLEDNEDELMRILHLKFLDGEDDFDYTMIDNDTELDDLITMGKDEEEKYFDEEEQTVDNQSTYTGVLDY